MLENGNPSISTHALKCEVSVFDMENKLLGKKAVLVDLDGTLFDTEKLDDLVLYRILEQHNIKKFKFNKGTLDNYLRRIKNGTIRRKIRKNFLKEYKEALKNSKIKINYSILRIIKKRKLKAALVTSNLKEITNLLLKKYRLEQYFGIVVTCEDVKNPKPSPKPYLLAIKKLKILNHEALIFEDSDEGVKSAKACKIDFIKVDFERRKIK